MGGSGPNQMAAQVPRSHFRFLALLAVQGAPWARRSEELLTRRAERQVRDLPATTRQAPVREVNNLAARRA